MQVSESGLNSDSNPIKIFKMFFLEDMIDMISYETNKYADEKKNALRLANKLKPHSRILKYTETDPDEMYAFHALIFLMGIIRKPSLKMYWTKDKMLETPFFLTVMTYNRFCQLLTMLHFSKNEDDSTDKLRKVRSVYELVIENFKAVYRSGENISIDESLIPWNGRLQFKQCNRNKRARFGIKIYKNCESKTGYVYNLIIYTGKDLENLGVSKSIGISGTVVKKLLGDLAGQGRSLYINNWYTSPLLCKQLVDEKTNVCGTVRENRKYMPKVNTKNMKVDDMKILHTPKIVFLAWKDKKNVTMLTTMNNPTIIGTNKQSRLTKKEIMKPNVVISYNNNMGGCR